MKEYWIAYNPTDGTVEYVEKNMHWDNGGRCWGGLGEHGMIHPDSSWASYRGYPMQVWLSDRDKM